MRFSFSKKQILICGGLVVWLLVVGAGLWTVSARSLAPGPSGHPQSAWPADSHVVRNADGFTLVVVLHPECPCSQATLSQLDEIMTVTRSRLAARILCVSYDALTEPVEQSDIWRHAQRISGATVEKDPGAVEARRFSALTSGETRLYGPDGALIFHGGITGARGHAGNNPGESAVLAYVLHQADAHTPASTPAFGCSL